MTGRFPRDELSDLDRAILDLERQTWRHPGAKETAVLQRTGLSAVRYYQRLNVLLDSPAALLADPQLVRRLQRVRDARREARRAA